MTRSRTATLVLALFAVPLASLFVSACGPGGEERPLLQAYFRAARLADRTTLNNIAMVGFDRDERGTITTFSVESVTEEQARPLRFIELSQALADAQEAEEAFTAEKVVYQDEHFDAINRVIRAERDDENIARRDVEVQEAWTEWRSRTTEQAKMVSGARFELDNEQNAAALSVYDRENPLDLTQYRGELWTKDVSITADVTLDDSATEQSLVLTLQKAVLTGSDGATVEGIWVVGNIR